MDRQGAGRHMKFRKKGRLLYDLQGFGEKGGRDWGYATCLGTYYVPIRTNL